MGMEENNFFLISCAFVFVLLSIFARGKNYAKVSVAVLRHNQRHSGRKLDAEDLFVPGTTILGGWRGLWDDRINRAGIRH